jgi:hypothetical protein
MTTNSTETDQSEGGRYVFCVLPRCPVCDSTRLETVRTEQHGDDAKVHRKKCKACLKRFFVVWE